MLRPKDKQWFKLGIKGGQEPDNEAKRWLEWATGLQTNAMYDRAAMFVRATKEGDNDFAAFGQASLTAELNLSTSTLLYRCWHLRDMAWCEGADGQVADRHRKWKDSVRNINKHFRGNLSAKAKELLEKNPYAEIEARHIVMLAEDYEPVDGGKKHHRARYASIWFEADTGHVLEETASHSQIYILPRWQTVSGSQYAYSPATVAALPDARLIQAMTLTLLEAGEKAVDPPLVAKSNIFRSDMNYMAGGLTYADLEEDTDIRHALMQLTGDKSGLPFGLELRDSIQQAISDCFYLNKLNLPQAQGDMTAFEVSQRVTEYVRNALPLFEPMEMEYNGALCDETFDILLRHGAFGSAQDMPQSLRGKDIEFTFESALHETIEKGKGQTFMEAKAILAEAAALDQGSVAMVDARQALRDTLSGIGVPAKWVRDEKAMAAIDAKQQQDKQAAEMIALMQAGGTAAKTIGEAGQAINGMNTGA